MAKTTAPILSFDARGSVAKTVVFSNWKGVKYARQHVVPANPKTVAQTFVRDMFAVLREMWKLAPQEILSTWNSFAEGRPFTGMNKWVGENVRVLNGETDMQNVIFSPGAKGGLPPESINAATGTTPGSIDVTFVVPAAPVGWTLTSAVAAAFEDQAPNAFFTGNFRAASDNAAPWVVTITGLTAGAVCNVGGWLVWTKPNGQLAYSVSLSDQATADT